MGALALVKYHYYSYHIVFIPVRLSPTLQQLFAPCLFLSMFDLWGQTPSSDEFVIQKTADVLRYGPST